MNDTPDFKVSTPKGEITVIKAGDTAYPGIWISINGDEMILVEYDRSIDQHVIRVWDSGEQSYDDYMFKYIIKEQKEDDES